MRTLSFPAGPVFLLDADDGGRHVLPADGAAGLTGRDRCWVLPAAPDSADPAWMITAGGAIAVRFSGGACQVIVDDPDATVTRHRARPNEFVLRNLASTARTFRLDLGAAPQVVRVAAGGQITVELIP
ncbi:hypothetical protein [Actinoplanes sp. NPDC026619]|uniref:hypothetical protein n=1 Tax=Actinoplanes sp. NPDC026619 TaxID=3155798 RepID=UPI003402CD39